MRKATPNNCLATLEPELARQWHPTKNGTLTPYDVMPKSGKKVWWLGTCGHEWPAMVSNRTNAGAGCPYCAGRKACRDNCLVTADPELARQWHPTKNGTLTPSDVTPKSGKKVWWRCPHGHEWPAVIASRTHDFSGCPYCAGKKATPENCLVAADPELARQWHPTKNGTLTPSDMTPKSSKEVWWRCPHGHEWPARVHQRANGNGCPYCSGHKVCRDNCLATLEPELAVEWYQPWNGKLTPYDVTLRTHKEVWWRGPCGHKWKAAISDRTGPRRSCCPDRLCRRKKTLPLPLLDAETFHKTAAVLGAVVGKFLV